MNGYHRILIANRGEIAVRIQRTCRMLGIETVVLYTPADQNSLHVRLADICIPLASLDGFTNPKLILEIARETGSDAIHPGYGFLAERVEFIRDCESAGISFIGVPAEVAESITDKISVLEKAQQSGYPVVEHSKLCFDTRIDEDLAAEADRLGYPLVIKPCRGGRGRGERLVLRPNQLHTSVLRSQAESQLIYGKRSIYLEKAILPAHQINVQILGDAFGQRIHLGEREGSVLFGNQKLFVESPAPSLKPRLRQKLWDIALELATLFNLQNVASVEFIVDESGHFYFTEVKSRIQIDHPITEMITRLDLVQEQIRVAAGEKLGYRQKDIRLNGWAVECRITAEDPSTGFLPSPGRLQSIRLPGGPEIRVDTFLYPGCEISSEYDSLIAKLAVWAPDRETSLRRARRALDEFKLSGLPTNIPLLQALFSLPGIISGDYNTNLKVASVMMEKPILTNRNGHNYDTPSGMEEITQDDSVERDLAAAAAIYFLRRNQSATPIRPERLNTGWHRNSRRLPE